MLFSILFLLSGLDPFDPTLNPVDFELRDNPGSHTRRQGLGDLFSLSIVGQGSFQIVQR